MDNKQNLDNHGSPSRADVHKMFDRIAPRYDLLNRMLSGGRDVAWRKRVARYLPQRDNMKVLDLATGTGDLLLSLYNNGKSVTAGVGIDMAEKMLALAKDKIAAKGLNSTLSVSVGDAREIPFEDRSFDAVSIAFGIRNVDPVDTALRQMHRILNDGGKALILEFSLPSNVILRRLYLLYFRYILPAIGSVISGDSYAYRYLNRTVETFPYGEDFCRLMREAGFQDVKAHPLTFGIATIYEGTRHARGESPTDSGEILKSLSDRIRAVLTDRNVGSGIVRLTADLPSQSPFDWLRRQTAAPRVYWADREGSFETAGVGVADMVTSKEPPAPLAHIREKLINADNSVRYYGGFRFDSNRPPDSDWQPFGSYFFILPRIELTQVSGKTHLVVNLLPERDRNSDSQILSELEQALSNAAAVPGDIPDVESRTDYPKKDGWSTMIDTAYRMFDDGTLEKIVLARKTVLDLSTKAHGLTLLQSLSSKASRTYRFYFEPQLSHAFFGATPERLYRRNGRTIMCDALAGTRPRGATDEADMRLGQELLAHDKDRTEQRLVVESIVLAMSPLGDAAPEGISDVELLKLSRVQHLLSRLKFTIRGDVDDSHILETLHPTAAVGGSPRDAAIEKIGELEPFDRGWYAGPVGWVGKESAEFAVAIRSAMAFDNRLNLYAGAGILRGSNADSEWNELESKISGFMEIFNQ